MKTLRMADLFCGAGGTTTGAVEAAQRLGMLPKVTAVNHWPLAIDTHSKNHPSARHVCASLDSVNPRDLFAEGELDLLLASPECMSHSVARGGRPVNDQSRATAWCVLRWADALRPPHILVENVPEFESWAPLGSNGRQLKSRRGEVFQAWCDALRALGYTVGHKVLCAADYGDPTTRRRLFIQAVRGRRKIVWPHPTHSEDPSPGLFGAMRPWVPARDIIDWNIKGQSIFGRKRPLSKKTLARIREGAEKFWPEPFVVALRGTSDDQIARSCRGIDMPLPTVATGNHLYVAEPLIVCMEQGGKVRGACQPLPTITTAKGGAMAVAEPFIVPNFGERDGQRPRVHGINDPLPTVTSHGAGVLVQPLILPQQSGGAMRPVSDPLPTVATDGAIALVEPLVVKFYGTGVCHSVREPLDTVTVKDRFAVAEPEVRAADGRVMLDILFRMLQPHELAGAQGFPSSYAFAGNKTQVVKQIGNAVPRRLARALVTAMLQQDSDVSAVADESEAA